MPAFPKVIPADYPDASAIPLLDLCVRQLKVLSDIDYAGIHAMSEADFCSEGQRLSEAVTALQAAAAEMCRPVAPRFVGFSVPFLKRQPPGVSIAFQEKVAELATLTLSSFLQHAGTGQPVCKSIVLKIRAREEKVHAFLRHMKAQLAENSKGARL